MANNIWQFLAGGITAFTAAGKLKTKKQTPHQDTVTDSTPPKPPVLEPEPSQAKPVAAEPVVVEPITVVPDRSESIAIDEVPDGVDKSETLFSATSKIEPAAPELVNPEPSSLPPSLDETPVSAEESTPEEPKLAAVAPAPEITASEITTSEIAAPQVIVPELSETPEPQDTPIIAAESSKAMVTTEAVEVATPVPQSVENVEAIPEVALASAPLTPMAEAVAPAPQTIALSESDDSEPELPVSKETSGMATTQTGLRTIATLWPSASQLDQIVRQAWNKHQIRTGLLVQRFSGSQWHYGVALSNQQVIVWEPDQSSTSLGKGRLAIYPLTTDYVDAMAVTYLDSPQIFQNILQSITAFHQEWVYAEGWNNEHWARLVTTGDPISYQVKEQYGLAGLDRPQLYQRPEAKSYLDSSLVTA